MPVRISFRLTLLAVLVGLVLVTAAAIGWISYGHGRTTAEVLSRQILAQTSHRVEQRVSHLLDRAVIRADTSKRLIESGSLPADDLEAVGRYLAEALAATPELSYLSFGRDDTGAYTHAYRDRDGTITIRFLLPGEDDRLALEDYRIGEGGDLVRIRRDEEGYDPRGRPYYKAATRAGEATWTDTYVFIGEDAELDVPGVTRAAPVYDEDGELLGVVSADFELLAISRYLERLDVGASGYAFLIEYRQDGTRRVIAHPRPELIVPGGAEEPTRADEIQDAAARALADKTPRASGAVPRDEVIPLELDADEGALFASLRRLGGADPGWGIAVVMPEDDVMEPVIDSRDDTLMASILALIVAVAVAVWLASRMAHSLKALAQETEAVGRMQFAPKPKIASALAEIDRLGGALEEMKTGLRSFQKFVPDDLVHAIIRSGEEAALGSDRRQVTVYFSDIVGFTPMAESLPTDELAALLGEYLGEMTREIHAQRGTVDKYIGDGIMAFWNAPEPLDRHAARAVATALSSQNSLARLREGWLARGFPRVNARIGIHTGEVVVGNFGSERRFDYTIIGDAVNLASRLEVLNDVYGTEILISEETREAVGEDFVVRAIDKVSVRGKSSGARIFEVVGKPEDLDDDARAHIDAYEAALDRYFAMAFSDAARAWDRVSERWPNDAAARIMAARARELEASPPPADWDGVHQMTTKG